MELDTLEIQGELEEIKEDIGRIIYWWRRYKGKRHKDTNGKFYDFSDVELLQRRLDVYFENPEDFNWDKPEMGVED